MSVTLCNSMDCSCQGISQQPTGVGCRFLFQGIFPTQRSNPLVSCISWNPQEDRSPRVPLETHPPQHVLMQPSPTVVYRKIEHLGQMPKTTRGTKHELGLFGWTGICYLTGYECYHHSIPLWKTPNSKGGQEIPEQNLKIGWKLSVNVWKAGFFLKVVCKGFIYLSYHKNPMGGPYYSDFVAAVVQSLSCVQLLATLWTARLLCPWDSPSGNTGVGCHFLLQLSFYMWGNQGLEGVKEFGWGPPARTWRGWDASRGLWLQHWGAR